MSFILFFVPYDHTYCGPCSHFYIDDHRYDSNQQAVRRVLHETEPAVLDPQDQWICAYAVCRCACSDIHGQQRERSLQTEPVCGRAAYDTDPHGAVPSYASCMQYHAAADRARSSGPEKTADRSAPGPLNPPASGRGRVRCLLYTVECDMTGLFGR